MNHCTYDSNLPGDVILKPQKLQSLPEALCTLVPAFLGSLEVVMIHIADDGSRCRRLSTLKNIEESTEVFIWFLSSFPVCACLNKDFERS